MPACMGVAPPQHPRSDRHACADAAESRPCGHGSERRAVEQRAGAAPKTPATQASWAPAEARIVWCRGLSVLCALARCCSFHQASIVCAQCTSRLALVPVPTCPDAISIMRPAERPGAVPDACGQSARGAHDAPWRGARPSAGCRRRRDGQRWRCLEPGRPVLTQSPCPGMMVIGPSPCAPCNANVCAAAVIPMRYRVSVSLPAARKASMVRAAMATVASSPCWWKMTTRHVLGLSSCQSVAEVSHGVCRSPRGAPPFPRAAGCRKTDPVGSWSASGVPPRWLGWNGRVDRPLLLLCR